MEINHSVKITRYGFYLHFEVNPAYSGFYWKATSLGQEEWGLVDFTVLGKEKNIFVETSFTPVLVEVFPVFAPSKKILLGSDLVLPGFWTLKFTNIKPSKVTLQFLGSEEDKYEGFVLSPNVTLEETKVIQVPFKLDFVCEKVFVKKSNYSEDEIEISDLCLINQKTKKVMSTDESLVKPEYEGIYRKNGRIVFSPDAPIWSFFTMKFFDC
jgi:hypothetical protein